MLIGIVKAGSVLFGSVLFGSVLFGIIPYRLFGFFIMNKQKVKRAQNENHYENIKQSRAAHRNADSVNRHEKSRKNSQRNAVENS